MKFLTPLQIVLCIFEKAGLRGVLKFMCKSSFQTEWDDVSILAMHFSDSIRIYINRVPTQMIAVTAIADGGIDDNLQRFSVQNFRCLQDTPPPRVLTLSIPRLLAPAPLKRDVLRNVQVQQGYPCLIG